MDASVTTLSALAVFESTVEHGRDRLPDSALLYLLSFSRSFFFAAARRGPWGLTPGSFFIPLSSSVQAP
jgi:hypothetical protein